LLIRFASMPNRPVISAGGILVVPVIVVSSQSVLRHVGMKTPGGQVL
jgi:hypothetical protein